MPAARSASPASSKRLGAVLATLVLAGALAIGAAPTAAAATAFRDVPANAYYADAVAWGQRAGITTGTSKTQFEPQRPVTRAELVTFLWRASGQPSAQSAQVADVPTGTWYTKAVDWAVQQKVTTLVGGTRRFEPHRTATRAEAVTFLWRVMGSPSARRTPFRDVAGVAWAIPAISWAHANGVTTGVGGTLTFDPNRAVSRADALVFVWRAAGSPDPMSVSPSSVVRNLLKPVLPTPKPKAPATTTTTTEPPATTATTAPPKSTTTTTAPKPPSTTTTTQPPKPPSTGFVHPGVLLDRAQLDHVKAKLAQGAEPWTSALQRLQTTGSSQKTDRRPVAYRYASLSYVPAPVREIRAAGGSNTKWIESNPQYGFTPAGAVEHLDDARAAYAHALLWYYTGDQRHADKAIQILDAWSSTLTHIAFDEVRRPDNNGILWDNGKLQAGWGASLFARAAEILRYSGAGWSPTAAARFERLLTDVYLPLVITGWSNGANWQMTFAEATIAIGVFTEDRAVFDAGVKMWREKVPSTIYLHTDGPLPVPPSPGINTESKLRSLWFNPVRWVDGLQAETLRDLSHMAMGLGAMANAAETARIQGVDLYGAEQTRIVAGFERSASYVNQYLDELDAKGKVSADWRPDGWLGSTFSTGGDAFRGGWEVAYQHFRAKGVSMPETKRLAERTRPTSVGTHMSWETLTHVR